MRSQELEIAPVPSQGLSVMGFKMSGPETNERGGRGGEGTNQESKGITSGDSQFIATFFMMFELVIRFPSQICSANYTKQTSNYQSVESLAIL